MKENAERAINQLKILIREMKEFGKREHHEQKAQLAEVNQAITNLERRTISIPPELKNLKNKLSVSLKKDNGTEDVLDYLKMELESLLKELTSEDEDLAVDKTKENKLPKVVFDDDMINVRPSVRAGRRR